MKFSNSEYANILFYYGKANGNKREAQRMYTEAFPRRPVPHRSVFSGTSHRVHETGCVARCRRDRIRGFRPNTERVVLESVHQDPTTSVRKIARNKRIPKSQVHAVLKHHKFHPYHYTPVQSLHNGDHEKRMQFCTLMLSKDTQNENFLKNILWTDESMLNREGITNLHNLHYYSQENPHMVLEKKHQIRFSLNVWAGVIGKTYFRPSYLVLSKKI